MIKNKQILKGLDHSQYEHPFDQKALSALQKLLALTSLVTLSQNIPLRKFTRFSIPEVI